MYNKQEKISPKSTKAPPNTPTEKATAESIQSPKKKQEENKPQLINYSQIPSGVLFFPQGVNIKDLSLEERQKLAQQLDGDDWDDEDDDKQYKRR